MSDLISIVVPAHNEVDSIERFVESLNKTLGKLKNYSFEIIFVDDGSKDDTPNLLRKQARKHKNIRIVTLSRNFGKEVALSAGLFETRGVAAIMIDADLQHPPRLIPKFIKAWEQGADVVVGVRNDKNNEPLLKRMASPLFYKLINKLSDTEITPNATDFRMLDRYVIDMFNSFTERNRIVRGLIDWLGFEHEFITFKPDSRVGGAASYSYFKLIRLAANSIVSMSVMPLRISMYLGIIIMGFTAPVGFVVILERILPNADFGLNFTGTAIIGLVIMFMSGLILFNVGLVASYIANIHAEVINRPLYVIKKTSRK